jgi:alpha-tubulin suppressor-like RCC1 family protein
VPTRVVGLDDVVEVTGGREHSCARTADGSVYCWGSNDSGELGDGTTTERHTPLRVSGL